MQEFKIFDDLYMFNSSVERLPLTFNQYLLLGTEPVLFHTGSIEQAIELVPKLKSVLGESSLSYIFVSHFESDECGGLDYLLKHFPEAKTICSQVTARQLAGFGITKNAVVYSQDNELKTDSYNLKFINYPSEMHLWEGLLAFDENRKILFSSDLFIRMGAVAEPIVKSTLEDEISGVSSEKIPNPVSCEEVKEKLLKLPANYIAPGHGPFIKL